MRIALRIVGSLALLSLIVWAATGVGWWMPIGEGGGHALRGFVLSMLHVAAILGGVFSFAP